MSPRPKLLVTGMFRSGTTLLSRLFNAHPEITFASDPYFEIFRALRNKIVMTVPGASVAPGAPLDDYFYEPGRHRVFTATQAVTLDSVSTECVDLPDLRARVAAFTEPYSPKISPHLDTIKGKTFRELFVSGFEVLDVAYGKQDAKLIGFKETWVDEFAPALLRAFPEVRVLHLIRDPRAVCASKNATEEKYPWLFLIRQWRKLTSLAQLYAQSDEFAGRVLMVRYEDLIADPASTIEQICAFLDVPMHPAMQDPEGFVDGAGQPWRQNSTFESKRSFNTTSINKWREVLTLKEAALIEKCCWFEMAALNYEPEAAASPDLTADEILSARSMEEHQIAPWLREHVSFDPRKAVGDMALERVRQDALFGRIPVTPQTKALFCLHETVFDLLQDQVKN